VGTRPGKREKVLEIARDCVAAGRYRDTRHARDRRQERQITLMEVKHVILTGFNEKSKDEYKPEYGTWNYAIRGKTVDGRSLRVAVSFEADGLLLIVTTIDLDG